MKISLSFLLLASVLSRAVAQETPTTNLSPGAVTPEVLETRMAEVRERAELGDEARSLLVGPYQQALNDLNLASAHAEQAALFQETTRTAPERLRTLREQQATTAPGGPSSAPLATDEAPLEQIEEVLSQETAALAAATARHADMEKQLAEAQGRPPLIRKRLEAIQREQEEATAALGAASAANEDPEASQARRWRREARSSALAAESQMLQQELISQPARVDLLNAQLDRERSSMEVIERRVTALRDLLHAGRRSEAEAAQAETEKALRETAGLDPVLDRLAAQNAELIRTLQEQASELDQMTRQREQAERRRKRIESDLAGIRALEEVHGRTEGLGRLLVRQRESLPDLRAYVRRARVRARKIAEEGVRHLDHRDEARELADLDQAVAAFETRLPAAKVPELRDPLTELMKQRQGLLEKAMDARAFYLADLDALDTAEKDLLKAVQTCNEFLAEHLLWLRSAEPTRLRDLAGLPAEVRRLLDPAVWSEMGHTFRREVVPSPVFWVVLVLAVVSVAKRNALTLRIQGLSEGVGNARDDRFAYTVRAIGWTLAAALAWPLLLATVGWQFRSATPTSALSYATGRLVLMLALHLYLLRVLSRMCIPRGVGEGHFRWPQSDVRLLRVALDRLAWVYVPTVFVVGFAIHMAPAETGGTIARLGLTLWSSAFALFFYHLFHSRREWLVQRRRVPEPGILMRAYRLWFTLLLVFPLGLAVLTLTGYGYSATVLARVYLQTLGMLAGLVVLHQLTMRLVVVVRHRLAYSAAIERRQAALAAREREEDTVNAEAEGHPLSVDEPEVDLATLSDDTADLVTMAAIAAGLIGLVVIWDELLPALRIFNEVTVKNTTLGSIGLALLAVIATTILARRLPAVMEIVLLRFSDMPAGSRHATTTLCTYAIVTLGALFALSTIGLRWSQLQWLAAALSVGIGFGLQEMVANFISGLIILFERPIRVGDIVTVGDTDGVVTRIRIRATTIRNWDRKELLVPNKEFITGRLLNWTLSDETLRILIMAGVVYGSDTDKALALMKEAALEHENVLDDPPPVVTFEGFGDNSLSLILRAYVGSIVHRLPTTTDLHQAIDRKFKEAGIVIAFPQRDVHLDISEPLRLSTAPREEDDTVARHQAQDLPERNES